MTEYQIYDQLSQSAGLLAAPIADFIRAGGRLNLFAQPRALTADDFSGDENMLLQTLVDGRITPDPYSLSRNAALHQPGHPAGKLSQIYGCPTFQNQGLIKQHSGCVMHQIWV